MNKRSASMVAGMLVAALMAGVVSRDLTLRAPSPVQIVVQTPAPGAPTTTVQQPTGERG